MTNISNKNHINLKTKKKNILYIIIFVAWLAIGMLNTNYANNLLPNKVDIFEVDSPALSGDVDIIGTLRKDPTPGLDIQYYLVLQDDRIVPLDSTAKSFNYEYIDQKLRVMGTIIPITNYDYPGLLIPLIMDPV